MSTPVSVTLKRAADYNEWRGIVRQLIAHEIAPEFVSFVPANASADLFGGLPHQATLKKTAGSRRVRVPRDFPDLAKLVLCHNDDARFALMYRLLWRLVDQPGLLSDGSDDDVWQAQRLAKSVRRDAHKMKAFVRFRKVEEERGEAFVAWFEPEHHIVERTAPFFARRFAGMRWSIVTPLASAHWDGESLVFGDGARRSDCPNDDALEDHWRVYYASIFNPARLKVNAMRSEMPVKYWKNLPESRLIPELTRSARAAQRAAPTGTEPSVAIGQRLVSEQPDMRVVSTDSPATLEALAVSVQHCARCDLCQHATGAVPGEGPANASMMIVGEQPGDQEDLAGRPFVGPAGSVLGDALSAAGLKRDQVYLTNAVKHFKHTVRGKRRLHQRPNPSEIEHCRWWLDLERDIIAPKVTVALGATAARACLGEAVTIADVRDRPFYDEAGAVTFVTAHPAYILRQRSAKESQRQLDLLVADLSAARQQLLCAPGTAPKPPA